MKRYIIGFLLPLPGALAVGISVVLAFELIGALMGMPMGEWRERTVSELVFNIGFDMFALIGVFVVVVLMMIGVGIIALGTISGSNTLGKRVAERLRVPGETAWQPFVDLARGGFYAGVLLLLCLLTELLALRFEYLEHSFWQANVLLFLGTLTCFLVANSFAIEKDDLIRRYG